MDTFENDEYSVNADHRRWGFLCPSISEQANTVLDRVCEKAADPISEGYSRADPASAGRRLVRPIGAGRALVRRLQFVNNPVAE
jgi:hypothetical protein